MDNTFYVLDESHAVVQSLSLMPQRGAVSSELRSLGIDRYREVFCRATNTEKLRGRWYRDDEKALATAQRAGEKKQVKKIHARIKNRRKEDTHQDDSVQQ